MNIISFVGELIFKDDKYYIENTKGLSNFFYDLYDKSTGNFSMPKMFKTGPIKQVINGGEALSIGGFLDYGIRKGIYQSLSEDKMERLTYFEGYDETISISPDQKLACAMTTRFSNKTSFEIIALIGQGNTSNIYLAIYKDEYVTLKVIDKSYIYDNDMIDNKSDIGFCYMGMEYYYLRIIKLDDGNHIELMKGKFNEKDVVLEDHKYDKNDIIFMMKYSNRSYKLGYNNFYFDTIFEAKPGRWIGGKYGIYERGLDLGSKNKAKVKYFKVVDYAD